MTIEINQNKFHGDSHSIDVDSSRRIVYLVTDYHGVYHIPLSDNHGNPIVNEVGGTYWKDGMYVSGALTLPDGTERPLGFRHRFIDANEPENWYDLELPPVARVRFDFFHDPEYADELLALPRAERTSILLRRIIVRYGDPEGLVHDSFMYNPDTMTPEVSPEVAMSDRAVLVPDGGSHRVTVSSGRRICRVDVRWGDAKPRINEMYQQGHADGLMLVNGQAQGDWRSLSFIETEIFAGIDQEPVTGEQSIEFRFRGDPARIHWINVYYHDQ